MSPRYITMKEPRRYRMAQKADADVQAVSGREEQPGQAMADWISSQIGQQSAAQDALTQVPEQNAFDSAVSLDQI